MFLLVFLLGCSSTEPSETTIVGPWAIIGATQVNRFGASVADSVAGQWTFRADGTHDGWVFIHHTFDVNQVWSGNWSLTGSTLHVVGVFSVPVAPPGFDPPSITTDYAVTLGPGTMVLAWGPDNIGDTGTLELVRQ